jgi:LCP family protein required for cell wall assembly
MVAVDAVLVGAAAWIALRPTEELLAVLLTPGAFAWLVLVNVAVLGYRAWATWDAWERGSGTTGTIWLVVLLAFVTAPHAGAAALHLRVVVAVERVFAAPSVTSTTTTPVTTTSLSEPTAQQPTATTTIPATTTATTSEGEPPWGEHLVLLLLGGDGGPDRDGVRTDAMLVVAVRSEDAAISVFSLPRNLRGFPFPNGQGFDDILNAVYRFGEEHPERFTGDDPGASALEGVVEAIIGERVDHHVLVDFEAFRAGVDALGGVTLPVPLTVTYPGFRLADGSRVDMVVEEGVRDLDGDMALAYVRSREEGTDYGRMERQKCVLAALLDQAEPAQALLALPSLLGAFEETVSTDIPRDVLPDIVTLLTDVDLDRVGLITLGPPAWHAGWTAGGWPIPDVPRIQEAVAAALDGAPPLDAGLIPATTSCGL